MLYIFWLLHQTTTSFEWLSLSISCISFDSYIKPQPKWRPIPRLRVVYLLTPTSNHNKQDSILIWWWVVYLLTPTSNHNCLINSITSILLYIFWLLHQTTTSCWKASWSCGCISFDSYIKLQLLCSVIRRVVYLLTPTSNHNRIIENEWWMKLYIFWLLHQTTTASASALCLAALYIFWLLHQTTTSMTHSVFVSCCISFDSYIKPQLSFSSSATFPVVYLLTPTSNHNLLESMEQVHTLYIFWLLHQTTTY